jgi:hypothetical protein
MSNLMFWVHVFQLMVTAFIGIYIGIRGERLFDDEETL